MGAGGEEPSPGGEPGGPGPGGRGEPGPGPPPAPEPGEGDRLQPVESRRGRRRRRASLGGARREEPQPGAPDAAAGGGGPGPAEGTGRGRGGRRPSTSARPPAGAEGRKEGRRRRRSIRSNASFTSAQGDGAPATPTTVGATSLDSDPHQLTNDLFNELRGRSFTKSERRPEGRPSFRAAGPGRGSYAGSYAGSALGGSALGSARGSYVGSQGFASMGTGVSSLPMAPARYFDQVRREENSELRRPGGPDDNRPDGSDTRSDKRERGVSNAESQPTSRRGSLGSEMEFERVGFIMDPMNSKFRHGWDALMCVLIIYISLALPFVLSFEPTVTSGLFIFDFLTDLCFIADIVLSFLTGYVADGIVVLEPGMVAQNYLTGWFAIDLVSAFPFDLAVLGPKVFDPNSNSLHGGSGGDEKLVQMVKLVKILRLLRLFRVARMSRIVRRLRDWLRIKNSHSSFVNFTMGATIAAHWIACFWFLVAQLEGLTEGTWVSEFTLTGDWEKGGLLEKDTATQYTVCIYHAYAIMASEGSHVLPATNAEHVYSIAAMLVGTLIFAYGLTTLGSLIFNLNKNDMAYRQRMDEVNDFMQNRGIPLELQNRVREFYDHLHERRRFFDADDVLQGLTTNLRTEVLMTMHKSMVLKNEFFKTMDPLFVGEVIQRLQMHSFMPGEHIVRQGSRGNEMYFIYDGQVEVQIYIKALKKVKHIAFLGPGDFMGEIALLDPEAIRTATVKAVTFCDIYSLSKEDIEVVLDLHPSQKRRWEEVSMRRKMELQGKGQEPRPLKKPNRLFGGMGGGLKWRAASKHDFKDVLAASISDFDKALAARNRALRRTSMPDKIADEQIVQMVHSRPQLAKMLSFARKPGEPGYDPRVLYTSGPDQTDNGTPGGRTPEDAPGGPEQSDDPMRMRGRRRSNSFGDIMPILDNPCGSAAGSVYGSQWGSVYGSQYGSVHGSIMGSQVDMQELEGREEEEEEEEEEAPAGPPAAEAEAADAGRPPNQV